MRGLIVRGPSADNAYGLNSGKHAKHVVTNRKPASQKRRRPPTVVTLEKDLRWDSFDSGDDKNSVEPQKTGGRTLQNGWKEYVTESGKLIRIPPTPGQRSTSARRSRG